MNRFGRVVVVLIAPLLASACAAPAALQGRIDGLSAIADNAEKNGAMKCAPRELALARSHLEFAKNELDQGEYGNAAEHVDIAAPNARAALANSPPDRCAPRGFMTPRVGDKDGDGIPDNVDKCPNDPENYNGYQDEDGCPDDPDTDGDGIPDSKDQCVMEPEDKDGYLDDDGCPDLDNDADGIPDAIDKCPDKPEDFDGFEDQDGCPDPDNDGDTVLDVDDMCPNTPGVVGGDKPGCPKKNMLVVVTAKEIRITQQIQFEFNKSKIKGDVSFKILDQIVKVLQDNPKITLEVQGHTDNVGSAAYNKQLSQDRADSVRAYLVAHGIDPSRLISKGYGMDKPLVPNNSVANRALNRRVQFIRTESTGSSTQP
ncbi:MAG TPA: OmpA family protein [Polyangiaceae bacterium]|jgi:outer membrane protein OmpA-like peptidoglycan-associated protein